MRRGLPLEVRLERNLAPRPWLGVAAPVASVALAFLLGGVFLAAAGYPPLAVYRELLSAGFTTWFGFTDTVAVATPLVLTGLAAAFAFRMNLYNVGAEGQLYVGAIASAWAGIALAPGLPRPLAIAAVLGAGAVGGALWIVVPAVTRALLGASEIITTLLLNYVALFLMRYLIFGSASYLRDPAATNFPQGRPIAAAAQLPLFGTTRVHLGLVVALVAVVLVWFTDRFTGFGFDMQVLGDAPGAARYAGIPVRRTVIVVLLVSGALAGLAGAGEVAGRAYALDPEGLTLSLGYTGIVVAALARSNPFGVVLVAVLLGGLQNAGISIQSTPGVHVPIAIGYLLQGAILLVALGGEVFRRNHLVLRRRRPAAAEAASA